MKLILNVALFAVVSFFSSEAGYVPPYITPCDMKLATFEKCVREQMEITLPLFAKGIPELKVPSLDPIRLDDINIDGQGLKLRFTEALLHGISNSKVTDLKVNLKDSAFMLAFKANVFLKAKYNIAGQILILPIRGEGDSKVYVSNLDVVIRSKLIHFNDTNGRHFKLTSPSYTYNIGNTRFEFENLFNGNKAISDATHSFANNNWRQIMDDLAPPVIKQIVRTGVKAINKFFTGVTLDQIVIE